MTDGRETPREPRPGLPPGQERVVALQLQQLALEAALASTGRVVQASMREFLR